MGVSDCSAIGAIRRTGELRVKLRLRSMATGAQNLVGRRVRMIRMAESLSQEMLAARCGAVGWDVSRGTFAKIEAGLRQVNDAEVLILAKALRRPVSDLFDGIPIKSAVASVRQGNNPG